jgi:preprotein translocase subunit SecG
MEIVVLIIHLVVCMCLIGLVLLQRSEGGALGMGGSGASALMSGRGAADALARMTSVAGGFFLVTSLALTFLSGAAASSSGSSVFDRLRREQAPATSTPTPAAPAQPQNSPPDPTQSSLEPQTQLASAAVPAPVEAAPPPVNATTRAAPLENAPAQQRAVVTPTQRPATTQPASAETQRRPPPARTAPATTPAAGTAPLQIPNTSGAVSGVNLTDDDPSASESIEIGNGVEAVRRERAGPDQ